MARTATGWGWTTIHEVVGPLDCRFPSPSLGPGDPGAAPASLTTPAPTPYAGAKRHVTCEPQWVSIDLDAPPATVPDAYLRLHLLSRRLVVPNSLNLDGIFAVLPNVVWTSVGPVAVDDAESVLAALRAVAPLTVFGVDKFPRLVDYVIPTGVRIADADRVRLGAHLAPGTTVMHAGFVNFNAGTLGPAMIEGRVSQGVIVGADSDVGGGASIMGTLSGGGRTVIRIGERCLLGAQAGLGISIGDDCVVEAGLYLTAGTKVTLPDGTLTKAAALSGESGWLYLRDSVTGRVIARPRAGRVHLNPGLHAN